MMATSTKSPNQHGSKSYYYPEKPPPSTPSPNSKRKLTIGKKESSDLSNRRTRSYELENRLPRRKQLAECRKQIPHQPSQDKDGDDAEIHAIKSRVLEELKNSSVNETYLRKRGFSVPGDHGEIPEHNIDIMKKETTLVVLEYLSRLPSDKLRARNRDVAKAKTIHITSDRPTFKSRRKSSLYRSSSDAGENFEEARKKFKEMALPLKRQLSANVLEEIKAFDKDELKKTMALNLKLQRPPSPLVNPMVLSPESIVVARLEDLSRNIMRDFPQVLDEPISDILTPLDDGDALTYETFAKVAKVVFEKNFNRLSGTLWSRIALVFYLVREIVYYGNLNDLQLELIVEYSAKFVTENSHTFIKKQGGWGALELEDDILVANGSLFDPFDYDRNAKLMRQDELSYECRGESNGRERPPNVTTFVNKWMSYGVAVAAIGLGVAYGFMKHF